MTKLAPRIPLSTFASLSAFARCRHSILFAALVVLVLWILVRLGPKFNDTAKFFCEIFVATAETFHESCKQTKEQTNKVTDTGDQNEYLVGYYRGEVTMLLTAYDQITNQRDIYSDKLQPTALN